MAWSASPRRPRRRAASGRRDRDRAAGRGRAGSGRCRDRARAGAQAARPCRAPGECRRAARDGPRASRRGRARERARLPGHRAPVKEDLRGIGERSAGRTSCCWRATQAGYRSLCRLVSRANLAGTKRVPRFSQALLAAAHRGPRRALGLPRRARSRRRLRVGDREGARAVAEPTPGRSAGATGPPAAGFFIELSHHLLPDDDWLVAESRGARRGARPAGRRHQRRPLRPPGGSRAPRRPDRDPPRPDARHAGRPPPARRRVVPEVRRGAARSCRRRCVPTATRGLGGGHRQLGRARAPRARSISASSNTASRASRSRPARRRSRYLSSSAGPAPAAATTR